MHPTASWLRSMLSGSLAYFTYLGGSDTDTVSGITLDAGAPDVIVTGSTVSTDFPVTAGAFQTCIDVPPPNPGTCPNLTVSGDAFVTKLDSTGEGLLLQISSSTPLTWVAAI